MAVTLGCGSAHVRAKGRSIAESYEPKKCTFANGKLLAFKELRQNYRVSQLPVGPRRRQERAKLRAFRVFATLSGMEPEFTPGARRVLDEVLAITRKYA